MCIRRREMKTMRNTLSLLLVIALVFALTECGGGGDAKGSVTSVAEEKPEVNMDNITINTQSSIRIDGSLTVYIDPYNRSEKTADADVVLITHSHYDHYDVESIKNVLGPDALIICPESMLDDVLSLGLKADVTTLTVGPVFRKEGISVEGVPAYNVKKKFHPKKKGWLGYIITMDGVRYYAAGDTDALDELKDIRCDVAFVPVGGKYTMTAEEAADLVNSIAPEYAVPIHYGSIVGKKTDADTFAEAVNEGITVVKKVEDAM